MVAALKNSNENHFSPGSDGSSERNPLKLPFIIGKFCSIHPSHVLYRLNNVSLIINFVVRT